MSTDDIFLCLFSHLSEEKWKHVKRKERKTAHTRSVQCCALGIPSASFNTISLVVWFKWFLFCCCHIGMCDPSFPSDTLLQYIAYLNSTPVRTPTIQLTASNKITKITKNYIHPIECRRRSRILIRLWLQHKWQRFRSCSKWGRKHFCVSKLLFVFWKKGRQRKWCVIVGNACIISCKIKMQTHWHN